MDLRDYGGKEYVFEFDNGLGDKTLLDANTQSSSLVSAHYLLLSCFPAEGEDWRWKIHVEVMCAATGIEYKTAVLRQEQWSCLGLGDWLSLCALERQILIRYICTNIHLLRSNDNYYLECKLGTSQECTKSTVAKTPIQLYPLDTDFILSTLPDRILLLREIVDIQNKHYTVSFYLQRKRVSVQVMNREGGEKVMEGQVRAEDYLYWWCVPIQDIVQICQWISHRILFMMTPSGEPSLQLPLTTITPALRFTFDSWQGESRGYNVRVYTAGSRLLVVAEDKTGGRGLHFAVVRPEHYSLWDVGDIDNLSTDSGAQTTVMIHLKSLMVIHTNTPVENKSVFLTLTSDSLAEAKAHDTSNTPFEATVDESVGFRYMGLLMDKHGR